MTVFDIPLGLKSPNTSRNLGFSFFFQLVKNLFVLSSWEMLKVPVRVQIELQRLQFYDFLIWTYLL